jgi:hypothetical protein
MLMANTTGAAGFAPPDRDLPDDDAESRTDRRIAID